LLPFPVFLKALTSFTEKQHKKKVTDADNVSKPNRKPIAMALNTLNNMPAQQKTAMLTYAHDYCAQKLTFDQANQKFEIADHQWTRTPKPISPISSETCLTVTPSISSKHFCRGITPHPRKRGCGCFDVYH
jgi:hypothetical protein